MLLRHRMNIFILSHFSWILLNSFFFAKKNAFEISIEHKCTREQMFFFILSHFSWILLSIFSLFQIQQGPFLHLPPLWEGFHQAGKDNFYRHGPGLLWWVLFWDNHFWWRTLAQNKMCQYTHLHFFVWKGDVQLLWNQFSELHEPQVFNNNKIATKLKAGHFLCWEFKLKNEEIWITW